MAITKSAKKALRQNTRRKVRNVKRKDKLKDVVKEIRTLIEQKKFNEAKKLLPKVYQTLDKTAKVGTIKKNTASRRKSRLTKAFNKAQAK
jgi:small subunit ribosomal protein S20